MLRKIISIGILWYFFETSMGLPAFADGSWLVFLQNQTSPASVWSGNSQPSPGQNVPSGATVMPWVIVNNDANAQHYSLVNGEISYNAPAPVVSSSPNPAQLVAAITADSTCQPLLVLLAPYQFAISQYAANPAAVKLLWSQLCQQYSSQLTPTIQATIQGYATAANMPLQ